MAKKGKKGKKDKGGPAVPEVVTTRAAAPKQYTICASDRVPAVRSKDHLTKFVNTELVARANLTESLQRTVWPFAVDPTEMTNVESV